MALRDLLVTGGSRDHAVRSLRAFEALYPYLETVAEATGLEPFDSKVVEAYWIGNELLRRDWREPFHALLRRLGARGLPRSLVQRLEHNLPPNAIPHHTFHVLFVGVGAVTGHVPTTLPNMDACRIGWGTVRELKRKNLVIERARLEWADGAFHLGSERAERVNWDDVVLPNLTSGDVAAIHWDEIVDRLNRDQRGELTRYTEQSIEAANDAARGLAALGRD